MIKNNTTNTCQNLGALYSSEGSIKYMQHEDFYKGSFQDAQLIEAHIFDTNFGEADLQRAIFTHCIVGNTKFVGADLSNIKCIRGDFTRTYFSDANLSGAKLNKSLFHEGSFDDTNMSEVTAHRCKFTRVGLERANFKGADLSGSVFANCDMDDVSFRGAKLTGCTFRSSCLDGADFTGAILGPDTVDGIYMMGAQFVGASMEDVKGIALESTTPLASLLIQTGKIRAYVVVPNDSVIFNPGDELSIDTKLADDIAGRDENKYDSYIKALYLNNVYDGDNVYMIECEVSDICNIPFGSDGVFYIKRATIIDNVSNAFVQSSISH